MYLKLNHPDSLSPGRRIGTVLGYLVLLLSTLLVTGSAFADVVKYKYRHAETKLEKTNFSIGQYQFAIDIDPSFQLEILNVNLQRPRVIHFAGERLFIGSVSGNVYWLDPPYKTPNILTTLEGYPHSIVVRNGQIYIARTEDILVAKYDKENPTLSSKDFEKFVKLPGGAGHNSRTLKLGPQQKLYVSLGITGNCSDQWLDNRYPFDNRRGGIFVIDESGKTPTLQPFGSGLRNPVGFAWNNEGSAIYATNNGPDHLGFDQPGETFSRITEGTNFGMPWYQHNGSEYVRDPCIASEPPFPKSALSEPSALLPARNAPMDMTFVPAQLSGKYHGDALIALHGSWATAEKGSFDGDPASRREPGIVRVVFENGVVTDIVDVLKGFQLEDGRRWGRPMGIAPGPDGHIYFTSDGGVNGLYRLRWND